MLSESVTDAQMNDALDHSSAPLSDGEIQRDSDMWFEDGNIVVIAQHTAFRFHKGALSRHSQVFRDLFLLPQPSDANALETFDHCPAVYVSDTSYDFRELLRAIYGGVSYLHPDSNRTVTFSVLAALARLSHKYQLDQLLEAVVQRLQRILTVDLEVWDRSGAFSQSEPSHALTWELDCFDAIEVLNLVRLLDRPEMLPMALYACGQLTAEHLVRGLTRGDGVFLETLSPSDLVSCLQIKRRLMLKSVDLLSRLCLAVEARVLQAASDEQCSSPFICEVRLRFLLGDWRNRLVEYVDEHPLDLYFDCALDKSEADGLMCGACTRAMKAKLLELRKEVWAGLPELMDLKIAGWNSS